jgi:low affinity Fe/Cu permease
LAAFSWCSAALLCSSLGIFGLIVCCYSLALHAKLDELLRVDTDARSELARLDEQEPEAIQKHRDREVKQIR